MTSLSQDSMDRTRESLIRADGICQRYEVGRPCINPNTYCSCRTEVEEVAAALDTAKAAEREACAAALANYDTDTDDAVTFRAKAAEWLRHEGAARDDGGKP
jgi:hypothetical protein